VTRQILQHPGAIGIIRALAGLPGRRDPAAGAGRGPLGYGEIWIGEMATFDAFTLAAVVAGQTSQAELTVGPLAAGIPAHRQRPPP